MVILSNQYTSNIIQSSISLQKSYTTYTTAQTMEGVFCCVFLVATLVVIDSGVRAEGFDIFSGE